MYKFAKFIFKIKWKSFIMSEINVFVNNRVDMKEISKASLFENYSESCLKFS